MLGTTGIELLMNSIYSLGRIIFFFDDLSSFLLNKNNLGYSYLNVILHALGIDIKQGKLNLFKA